MRNVIVGVSLFMTMWLSPVAFGAATENAKGHSVETVRKTCDCVRRHPSGFPYIEQRITTCKTYKNEQGRVKALDCLNCYTLCTDKATS